MESISNLKNIARSLLLIATLCCGMASCMDEPKVNIVTASSAKQTVVITQEASSTTKTTLHTDSTSIHH